MTPGGRLGAARSVLAVCAVLVAVGGGSARAEDGETGRRFYKKGEEFLKAGDYRSAAAAFQSGYAAAPRVGFLLNIGNCYRKLGELGKAREFYWRFLDAAPKSDPSRAEVTDYLRAMEQMEADGVSLDGASSAARPAPAPEVVVAPSAAARTPSGPTPGALSFKPSSDESGPGMVMVDLGNTPAPSAAAESAPRPLTKKWWFWTLVGGVVVAGGVAAFALTRHDSGSP